MCVLFLFKRKWCRRQDIKGRHKTSKVTTSNANTNMGRGSISSFRSKSSKKTEVWWLALQQGYLKTGTAMASNLVAMASNLPANRPSLWLLKNGNKLFFACHGANNWQAQWALRNTHNRAATGGWWCLLSWRSTSLMFRLLLPVDLVKTDLRLIAMPPTY